MNTRLALAVSLAVSMTSAISAEQIKIKGMYIGMPVDKAITVLSDVLAVPADDIIVVRVEDGGKEHVCLFTGGIREELADNGPDLCSVLHGNLTNIMTVRQNYAIKNLVKDAQAQMARAVLNEEVPEKPFKQATPLATFTNNSMVTMTWDSATVDRVFSFGNSEFTVFAKGLVNAYNIPTLNKVKCAYADLTCWEYNNGDGAVLSIIDAKRADGGSNPPVINMFVAAKTKPLNF